MIGAFVAVDRDVRAVVTSGNIPGHVSPERRCVMGWREV